VSATESLEGALLATGFPYDIATNPLPNLDEWAHLQRVSSCRRLGSASLDACMVGCGWFDGYWERHLNAWDVGAAALVVAEAGGTITKLDGSPFDPHAGQLVATNGAIHAQLLAELAATAR
jgi:myo-inositol-1(or 4)-monophosphatase